MCSFFSEFWIFLYCARTFNLQTHVSDVLWYVFLVSILCGFRAIFLVCGNVILIPEGGRCIFFPIQSEEPDVCFRLLGGWISVVYFPVSFLLLWNPRMSNRDACLQYHKGKHLSDVVDLLD